MQKVWKYELIYVYLGVPLIIISNKNEQNA